MISAAAIALAAATLVAAQGTSTVVPQGTPATPTNEPLASQTFASVADLPYQINPFPVGRGPQAGYNECNATTAGPNSMCQTAYIDSVADFCVWGGPTPDSVVGDVEGGMIAWCTTAAHGTRVMPAGTITGAQFLIAPAYVQITGIINQAGVDIAANDSGGELDPWGADGLGNPVGASVWTNAFPQSNNNSGDYIQAVYWHNFMGSGMFCFKACNPNNPDAALFCNHIYDQIGCAYNAPASYAPNVFETCLSDNQDYPGVYTGANGVVTTYSQPPASDGVITTMPYTAKIPATSSCTTYQSSQLYGGNPSSSASSAAPTGTTKITTGTSKTSAASTASSTTKSTSGAHLEGVKFGGVIVAALGVLVGAVMVL